MSAPFRVGVAGLGVVGGGVIRLLTERAEALAERCGRRIALTAVSARDRTKARAADVSDLAWSEDPVALAERDDVDCIVELIGGAKGPALALTEKALAAGKHVVTANKAMLAVHGARLAKLAESKGVSLNFEAAAAGGIPIVKALREGLAANRISRIYGILNGTCNYILTKMEETGRPYADVLAEAQALGYAEADPTFDVGGIDTAHKLTLLAALAFGTAPDFDGVAIEGIQNISALDIAFARELGYRIKLLGVARRTALGLEQRVNPAMVKLGTPLSDVAGVFNAVVAEGDAVGPSIYEGRGAGAMPTASAVVADLLDIARGTLMPAFGTRAARLEKAARSPVDRRTGPFYLRFIVMDRPGVMAAISQCLAEEGISIESMLQRGRAPGEKVPIVMITHAAEEAAIARALKAVTARAAAAEPPCMIRMEEF